MSTEHNKSELETSLSTQKHVIKFISVDLIMIM